MNVDKTDIEKNKVDRLKGLQKDNGNFSPKSILPLLKEAKDKSSTGEFKQGLEILNFCASIEPDFTEIYLVRAELYQQQGDYKSALFDLNRAISLAPDNARAYTQRGEIYRLAKRIDAALQDFGHAIELDPQNVFALGRRGTLYRSIHRYSNSLRDYNQALAFDPANTWIIGNRAETYRALKNYRKAVDDYNQVLALNPQLGWVYERRAYPNLCLGNIDEACADFEIGWKQNPANLTNGWMAEWTRMSKKGFTFSQKIEERLVALAVQAPQHYAAYLCRATLDLIQGNFEESYIELNTAINLLPEEPGAYFWKGIMAVCLEKDAEAVELINKALQLKMPPALLAPIKWLEPLNPVFYKEYGRAFLAKSPEGKSLSPEEGGSALAVTPEPEQLKKNPDTAQDLTQERPIQPSQENTLKFHTLSIVPPGKPLAGKTSPDLSPTKTSDNPDTDNPDTDEPDTDDEVTQRIKVKPFNSASPVEPPVSLPEVSRAESPVKPSEVSPAQPEEKPGEASMVDLPVKPEESLPEEISAGAVEAVKEAKPETNPVTPITPPDSNPILREKDPEPLPVEDPEIVSTLPPVQPDNSVETIQKAAPAPKITLNDADVKEKIPSPPAERDNDVIVTTVKPKKGRLLLVTLAGTVILTIGLLILALLFINNSPKSESNSQAVSPASVPSPTGQKSAPTGVLISVSAGPALGSPPASSLSSQPTTSPVATEVSQEKPTAVLELEATPTPPTPVSGLTVTSAPTKPTFTVSATPTINNATTPIAATQAPPSPFSSRLLAGNNGTVTTACGSVDGRYFATGSDDKTIKIWEVATGKLTMTLTPQNSAGAGSPVALSWSSDGNYLISGWADNYIRVFNISANEAKSSTAGEQTRFLSTDNSLPQTVAVSNDSMLVAYPGKDTVHTQNIISKAKGPDYSLGRASQVTAIKFSPDNKYLAAGLSDGRVLVWDKETLKLLLAILPSQNTGADPITTLEWGPDSGSLAVGSQKTLVVYRVILTGGARVANTPVLQEVKAPVKALKFSRTGSLLASGYQDGQFQLWSVEQNKLLAQESSGSEAVLSLSFSSDERQIFILKGGNNPTLTTYTRQQ